MYHRREADKAKDLYTWAPIRPNYHDVQSNLEMLHYLAALSFFSVILFLAKFLTISFCHYYSFKHDTLT